MVNLFGRVEDREATREDPSIQFREVSGECCPYESGFLPMAKLRLESRPNGDQYFSGLADGEQPRLLWEYGARGLQGWAASILLDYRQWATKDRPR